MHKKEENLKQSQNRVDTEVNKLRVWQSITDKTTLSDRDWSLSVLFYPLSGMYQCKTASAIDINRIFSLVCGNAW